MFSPHHHEEHKDHDFQGDLDHQQLMHHQPDALHLPHVAHFDPDEPPPPHPHHHDHHDQLQAMRDEVGHDHHLMDHHEDSHHHHLHEEVHDLDHEAHHEQLIPTGEDQHGHSPPPMAIPALQEPVYDPPLDDDDVELERRKKRRRYSNDFKSRVIQQLKTHDVRDVSRMFAIPENTVREWTKVSVVQSIEAARNKSGGSLKANGYDPLHRLSESLVLYFQRNAQNEEHMRQPITTKLIVSKALESRNNLLELNEIQPFLNPKEKKALQRFMGSDSWAKKFARRYNLKMSGTRVKDLADEDLRNYCAQLRQMAGRVKQGGPDYDEAAALMRQAAEKLMSAKLSASRRMSGQSMTMPQIL